MEVRLHPLEKRHLEWLLQIRNHESTRSQLKNDTIFTLEECEKWFETLKSPWYVIMDEDLYWVGYVRTDGDEVGCDIHLIIEGEDIRQEKYKEYLKDKTYGELDVFEDNHIKSLYEELGFKETGEVQFIRGRKYLKMIYENRN